MTIDTDDLIQIIITVICSVVGASGFWAFVQHKTEKNDAGVQLLMGVAHDLIISHGMQYIDRGWISQDEYADFVKYLYEPYEKTGGNGLARRVFNEVSGLPIRNRASPDEELIENRKEQRRNRREREDD